MYVSCMHLALTRVWTTRLTDVEENKDKLFVLLKWLILDVLIKVKRYKPRADPDEKHQGVCKQKRTNEMFVDTIRKQEVLKGWFISSSNLKLRTEAGDVERERAEYVKREKVWGRDIESQRRSLYRKLSPALFDH